MKRYHIVLVLAYLSCLSSAKDYKVERKVEQLLKTVKCSNNNKTYHLSHFKATRADAGMQNDVIHYIVATVNRPTIIMRHVFKDVKVTFNDTAICTQTGQAVSFSDDAEKPQYSGTIISNIFPYIDGDDVVDLPPGGQGVFHNHENVLDFFTWVMDSSGVKSSSDPSVSFSARPTQGFFKASILEFAVDVRYADGYQKTLPGYPKDANLTQFYIKLNNLPGKVNVPNVTTVTNLRYAIELFFFTVNNNVKSSDYKLVQSIDDEYSPGVFSTWSTTISQTQPGELYPRQSYIAWKPVSYKTATPSYEKEAFAHPNIYNGKNSRLPKKGSFSVFNENYVPWSIGFHPATTSFGVNVTLGQEKDGGYVKSKYIQWSAMIGSGKPPLDVNLSDFAKVVITLGLGGPFVAGLLIAVFVWIIRRLWRSNSAAQNTKYDRIN